MGLAKSFNKALHKQLKIYAAWAPVTNTFELGDYGWFEGGVFRKAGRISEFEVDFVPGAGQPTSIDFMSEGITTIKTVAGVEVPALEGVGDVEATLSFNFSKGESSVIKASLNVVEMQNINQVGKKLAKHSDWEKYYRVVSSVYTGEQCVIIATAEADTTVEFSGKASALSQIELGKVELKASVVTSTKRSFRSIGDTGAVGLGLFKIGWFDKVKLLGGDEEPEIEKDWGDEIEDDF